MFELQLMNQTMGLQLMISVKYWNVISKDAKQINMIQQQWLHYFYNVWGNCKISFQAVDSPGVEDLFTTLLSEKNVWMLFDVEKLPGAPKTKLASLTLLFFSSGEKKLPRIFTAERVRKQVTGPSCEGMNIGGVIWIDSSRDRKRAQREKQKREYTPPHSCKDFAASCLTASKTIRPFFPLPFPPLKKSDSGTQHNI